MREEYLKHLRLLLLVAGIWTLLFWILFYRENFFTVLGFSLSFVWLFVLPGYSLLHWFDFSVSEKVVAGSLLGFGVVGVISFSLGSLGIPVWYHWYFLPPMICVVGFAGGKFFEK